MKTLYFNEGIKIPKKEIHSKLLDKNRSRILEKLELAKILKHSLPMKKLDGEITGQEHYIFNYVGFIVIYDVTFIIYPKYIKDISKDRLNGHRKLKQIIQVIDKFQTFSISALGEEVILDNFISTQLNILQDYLRYGLYNNINYVDEINGEGAINWERTINETKAYIVNENPYYLDMYTQKPTLDESDIIRRIHKIVLTDTSQNIKPIISVLGFPELKLTDEKLDYYGNQDHIEIIIEQEMSRQFIDDKRNILNNLLDYITQTSRGDYLGDTVRFYGTTAFNLVWEDVVSKIYNNNLKDNLSSLGLVLKSSEMDIDYSDRELLKDVVEKPLWLDILGDNEVSAGHTFKLDALNINHKEKSFDIYDAKYYQLEFKEDSITGQPGMADLTKQYFYEFAFKRLADLNEYDINSYFIVPQDELSKDYGEGVEIAKASLDIFNLGVNHGVVVIARDCELAYTEYLLGK